MVVGYLGSFHKPVCQPCVFNSENGSLNNSLHAWGILLEELDADLFPPKD